MSALSARWEGHSLHDYTPPDEREGERRGE